ncbi:hypothetical protein HU200_053685 [Digitaria exilis]|uniref:Uncharacterized protein n=1 Tax=Digitaria exilis TaxID=1010633 RepID=A0A835E7L4_9POAL|nr:hypothetical protein HU200_053685 [Digitaria exilis]
MALSLSSGRRKWACRAAHRGGKAGAGCRHFHFHYHVPRQVWPFLPLRLPARFSLLPYLLIIPVFFFAMLAFLVCFGWFTLVYFVSSLWSKRNGHELGLSSSDRASDAAEPRGEEEEGEDRAVKRVAERAGGSRLSEVCVKSQEIKELFEDWFSEESRYITRMASPGVYIDNKEHADEEEIVKEVMMFESDKKEVETFVELDGSSEKYQQLMETSIDCFVEELNTRELGASLTSKNLFDVPYDEEFVGNKKEMEVLSSLEILEFIDKHDATEIVANGAASDFETPEAPSLDDSVHHDIGNVHREEIEQEQSTTALSHNNVVDRLPEGILQEWQETQNLVTEHNKNLPEDISIEEDGKHAVGISDEVQDSLCDPTVWPLDSVCEMEPKTLAASSTPFYQATSDQDSELEEELSKNKRVESSASASAVRDFAYNHWRIIEQLDSFASGESIHQEGSPENLALETAEDEVRDENCTSTGASSRLPLLRRSPTQWWNLCGVLDAFAGGEH